MDKIMEMADRLFLAIKEYEVYKDYKRAMENIKSDKALSKRIDEFKKRHLAFVTNKKNNIYSFDEERYLSQEYYKIILNRNAKIYFENGIVLIDMMNKIINKLISEYTLDVFLGDEK